MKKTLEQISNNLLDAFYPSEIVGYDIVEKYGIEDNNSTYKISDLPEQVAKTVLEVARKIKEEVEKDGYAWYTNEKDEAVLFVKTENGIDSVWVSYDTRLTNEILAGRIRNYLSSLNELYEKATSEKAKEAIANEAGFWKTVYEHLPPIFGIPSVEKLAPNIFPETENNEYPSP